MDLSLKLSASIAKEMVTGSGTTPNIWQIRRMVLPLELVLYSLEEEREMQHSSVSISLSF